MDDLIRFMLNEGAVKRFLNNLTAESEILALNELKNGDPNKAKDIINAVETVTTAVNIMVSKTKKENR